jgi:hypothetical protein
MPDDILNELWAVKDAISREYEYDLEALVAYFRSKEVGECQRVVDLRAVRRSAEQHSAASPLTATAERKRS